MLRHSRNLIVHQPTTSACRCPRLRLEHACITCPVAFYIDIYARSSWLYSQYPQHLSSSPQAEFTQHVVQHPHYEAFLPNTQQIPCKLDSPTYRRSALAAALPKLQLRLDPPYDNTYNRLATNAMSSDHTDKFASCCMPTVRLASNQTQLACLQALTQELIFEPLLEQQEQYAEDGVQPIDREDAVALTKLLDQSLPLGSIQVACSNIDYKSHSTANALYSSKGNAQDADV